MKRLLVISLAFFALVSCNKDNNFSFKRGEPSGPAESWAEKSRVESTESRNVMLLYSAGFNTLARYLDQNIVELDEGFIPEKRNRGDHVLLVYSKLTTRNENGTILLEYDKPTKSALFRMYKVGDKIVKDTLKVYGEDVIASSPETLRDVCLTARDMFPAKSYGMVFTSHASGWLPDGYYNDPSRYEGNSGWGMLSVGKGRNQRSYPALETYPAVKSIGQENIPGSPVEMELDVFAEAIPFHLDYLLLDACLSGCIEVAYQLRGKADIVGFSQTEVLAEGFDYRTITSRLLTANPDPVQVCKDYFNRYDVQTGQWRSATISAVDTRELEPLATLCKTLFEKYRTSLKTLKGSSVQGYFRSERHFFYDLRDILVKAGITAEEEAALQDALDRCMLYKAATDYFLSVRIYTACGFSMYLPSMGSDFLDNFYKEHIAWNQATELVK